MGQKEIKGSGSDSSKTARRRHAKFDTEVAVGALYKCINFQVGDSSSCLYTVSTSHPWQLVRGNHQKPKGNGLEGVPGGPQTTLDLLILRNISMATPGYAYQIDAQLVSQLASKLRPSRFSPDFEGIVPLGPKLVKCPEFKHNKENE